MVYSDWTYETVLAELINKLQQEDSPWGSELAPGSVGHMLGILFSYTCDQILFQMERRVEEWGKDSALLRVSITGMAKLLGYTARRRSSATGYVLFTTASGNPTGTQIDIPKYTVVSTSGIDFITMEGASILAGATYSGDATETDHSAEGSTWTAVKQGELKTTTQAGTGAEDQYVDIPVDGEAIETVEEGSIEVTIDGTTWAEVDSFYDASGSDYVVETYASKIRIWFGDGVNGNKPEDGAPIIVSWVKSDGAGGNVMTADYVNQMTSPTGVSLSNSTLMAGGEDAEDIEEIRRNMSRAWAAQNRLVTRQDYIGFVSTYPGIETANVWGEDDLIDYGGSSSLYAWKVVICAIMRAAGSESIVTFIGHEKQEALLADIELLKCVTADVAFIEASPVLLQLSGRAKLTGGVSWTDILGGIESNAFSQYSSWVSGLNFEEEVKRGDLVQLIENTEGVDYTNSIKLRHYLALTAAGSPAVTFTGTMKLPPQPETIEVGIITEAGDWQVWGWDGGTGSFTGPKISSGTVHYVSGAVAVTFTEIPPLDSEGDLVTVFCRAVGVEAFDDEVATTADGSATEYRFTLRNPVHFVSGGSPATSRVTINYTIGGSVYEATDDGSGTISGTFITTGLINYDTGSVYLDFSSAPDDGSAIYATYWAATQNYVGALEKVLVLSSIILTGEY